MFKNGFEEAKKLLSSLNPTEARRILEDIKLKDPDLAQKLESELISIEDITKLTLTMKMNFLREVELENLGLALKTVKDDVRNNFYDGLSQGIILDIEDGRNGKLTPLSQVEEAQIKIVETLKQLIDRGVIGLNDSDEWV